MLPSDAPAWALLSVLGVPGWGPLHWLLKQRGDRVQLASRLRQSLHAAALPVDGDGVPAGRLLTALLRAQSDLDPVTAVNDPSLIAGLRYRHRLVCRDGVSLVIRSWERFGCGDGEDGCGWSGLGPGQPLKTLLQPTQHKPEDCPRPASCRPTSRAPMAPRGRLGQARPSVPTLGSTEPAGAALLTEELTNQSHQNQPDPTGFDVEVTMPLMAADRANLL